MLGKILAIIIPILSVLFVGWVIIKSSNDRKKGKGCCGNCESCSACKYTKQDDSACVNNLTNNQ